MDVILPFVGKSLDSSGPEAVFGYIFGYDTYINTSVAGGGSASSNFVNTKHGSISGGVWQYTDIANTNTYSAGSYNHPRSYFYYIPTTIKNVTITRQTAIPIAAFNGCSFIEKISLPETTSSIGSYAFQNCSAVVAYDYQPTISTPWDGSTIAAGYHGGSGTQDDPYQIFTPSEFMYFISQVNSGTDYSSNYFIITSDLDFAGYSISQASHDSSTSLSGHLDGNNHCVKNLIVNCNENSYIGLFGFVNGTINNIDFSNLSLTFNSDNSETHYCGLIVGYLSGELNNVSVNGTLIISTKRTCYVGGIVGYNCGVVTSCISGVSINATSTNYKCYVGGIVGYNCGSIINPTFVGTINATGYSASYTYTGDISGFDEE